MVLGMGESQIGPRVLAYPAYQSAEENPYITGLYEAVREQGITVDEFDRRRLLDRYDVVHIHWPEQIIEWTAGPAKAAADVAKVLGLLTAARLRGAKLVWTGHDLGPHDMPHPRLYRAYVAAFSRMVDALISLDQSSIARLHDRYPALRRVPVHVVPHGHYRDSYPVPPARSVARALLGMEADGPVLLLLGRVKRYKSITTLVEEFARRRSSGSRLVVAGKVAEYDPGYGEEVLAAAAAAGDAVHVQLGSVPAVDVPVWHAAADVVVLPYTRTTALHSGAALLALSMGRPVVVTDTPTMRELRDLVGEDWVHLSTGAPADALEMAEKVAAVPPDGAPDLSSYEPVVLGRRTADVYRSLVSRVG